MSALVFRITADATAAKAAFGEVGASLASTASRVDSLSNKLGSLGSTLSLGITAPVAALAAATVRSATSLDSLTRGLEAVSGSAEAAQAQLVSLREVAKLPGLGFREAIEGSVRLQAAGFSAQLSERSLKAFGNALATVGKGKADLDGVTLALSQIASKGKISAEEINQLAERVPQIRKAIQAAFGTADTEVLQRLGVSSEEFVTKIVGQLEKLKLVTGGPQNAFENLSDAINDASARVGAKLLPAVVNLIPVLETIAGAAANLADVFTRLPQPVQAVGLALAGIIVASGPIISAYRGIAAALTTARDAYLAMAAAQAASAGAGVVSTVSAAASAAKGVADAAAQIRAAKVALDAAVGIGYAETLAAQGALKAAQAAYMGAIEAEKAAITLGGAARTATVGLGTLAGATVGAGIAVATVVSALNTSTTALEEQKRAADESAAALKRLNDRFKDVQNTAGKDQQKSFADFDRELANRISELTQKASEGDPKIEGLINALKSKPLPTVKSIIADAGLKQGFADYKAEIDKLRTAEKSLLELQASGKDVNGDLAIVRKKLADATKELATAMGETEAAVEKVRAKLATIDTAALFARGQDAAQQQAQAINNVAEIFKRYGVVTVASAERMIRQQALLFQSYRQLSDAPDISKKFSIQPESTKAIDILIASYQDLANQPDITKNVNIKLGELPKFDFPNFPEFPTDKAAKALGVTTQAMREAQAREAQKQVDILREANKRNPNEVSGNDVSAAEQKVKEILEGADKRTEKLSRGLQQVSTIITDLSRSVSNSAIDLLFTKPVADTSRFQEELAKLRAEQEKLTAAQRKGQNVTAALTENQRKMAQVNQQMADAVKRTSLSFRAMEALKSIAADVAKSITRLLIEGALKRLGESLLGIGKTSTGVFGGLGDLISGVGKVFGSGGTGVIKSAVPGVTAIGLENGGLGKLPGFGGGSSSSVASSLGSAANIANLVTGAVSAVSNVVGNFQMAKLEKTLNAIEKSTRYTQIYTGEQSDSLLNTAHSSLVMLGMIAKSTSGLVGVNITGTLNSEQTSKFVESLVNGSAIFWQQSQGTLLKIQQALESGFALIAGPLNKIANPSLFSRLLSGSGLFGGNPIAAGGGLGQSLGAALSGPLGTLGSLIPDRKEGTLNAIELNTRKSNIFLGEQSQSILWCAQKTTEYMGYAVASLDAIGRFSSDSLANLQQIAQGGSLAFAGGGGDTFNFDLRGANLGGMTEANAVQILTTAVKKMKLQGLNRSR